MNDTEWQALRNKARGIAIEEYTTEASSIIRLTKEEITSIIEEAGVDKEKLSAWEQVLVSEQIKTEAFETGMSARGGELGKF